MSLSKRDPEIAASIERESNRQHDGLEMIASENYVSPEVLEAQGSILTNKYAEGYPGKRYYGGCMYVDEVEQLAIDRAKKIFSATGVNVQPHSGSQANMAVYMSFLKPGDTILGMDLSHGGHLTHGSPANFSGKLYRSTFYGVDPKTKKLDYDQILSIAKKEKPKAIIAGASAYPRTLDFEKFRFIADQVEAKLVVDMAHIAGLVASGMHPSPLPYAHYVTTTTHKTLRGPRGGMILSAQEDLKPINSLIFPGIQGGPLMHVIAAKAVAFGEALKPGFKTYSKQVVLNAQTLAQNMMERGYDLVSGGTDNHLILVDLTSKGITGKEAEHALDLAGITVNKNTVPFETKSPFITSGIRLGTPALTTRGLTEAHFAQISKWIDETLQHSKDENRLAKINASVKEFARQFPLYKEV